MMKISSIIKKFGITGIFLALLTGCVIAIGFHNYKTNSNFWSASAVNCVTIIVAIFISYWLTQKGNDIGQHPTGQIEKQIPDLSQRPFQVVPQNK